MRLVSHGECAADRPQIPSERELAGEFVFVEAICGQLPGGGQYAKGDGQVETPALLGQVGRREVDREPARGKFETRVHQRRAYPVAAFLYLGLGEADDGETG